MKKLDFIYSDNPIFGSLWDRFCANNANVSWAYLPDRIKFYDYFSQNCRIKNLSFIIVKDNKPLCICLLFLEKHGNRTSFTYSGGFLRSPLFATTIDKKLRKNVETECFAMIDHLSSQHQVDCVKLALDPLSDNHSYNMLVKHGFFDTSTNTSILDIQFSEKELWNGLRKSYRSLINNGKKYFDIVIMDHSNANDEMFEEHKKLHYKAAGRITRPVETWSLQYDLLTKDNGILIGLKENGKFVAFSYFAHSHSKAYYGSSSDDPDYDGNIPLEHIIIWTSIEYYKKRDFKLLELGHQSFGSQLFGQPSKKDINISFFKRGFGGDVFTLYRGIKYYNRDFMQEELEQNIQKLFAEC